MRLTNATMAGRIPYAELGPRLERIQFQPGQFECPDFPTLAAWSLERSAQSGARIVECPSCQRPHFVSRGSSAYCRRPAPGLSTTCAQSYAHEVFAERRNEWNKEYRRIHARKLRGTVSEEDWQRWRTDPDGSARAPEIFTTFDRWIDPQVEIDRQMFKTWHDGRNPAKQDQRQTPDAGEAKARFDDIMRAAKELAEKEESSDG